jgi:replication factor C subunit 1
MDDLWINKYKPKSLNNLVGHSMQIKKIQKWLDNLGDLKYQSLVISGNHGIGKNSTINLILENNNYIAKTINPNQIKDHRNSDNFYDYYNHNNSIISKINFNNKKKKKLAIIFNDTESISLNSEKKYVFNIFKENNKLKAFPLIFITNNHHSKLINDLKKYSPEIKFYSPSSYELKKLIKKICKKENIFIQDDVIDDIIIFSQFDIKRLLNILQEISFHYTNKKLDKKGFIKYKNNSKKKNVAVGLFDSTLKILNSYKSNKNIYKLYESEKVLLPLMIHQNYKKKIFKNNNISYEEKLFKLVKITDSISRGDNIETSIYTDQNWYLQNIHGFYTCLNTSYWINKSNDNRIKIQDIKFSSDLNKTSLKNINKKNINNLLKIFPKKSIEEILMLNRVSNFLVKNKQIIDLIKTLKNYNKDITIKDIELCLKIDKTYNFIDMKASEKKKISDMIKNI